MYIFLILFSLIIYCLGMLTKRIEPFYLLGFVIMLICGFRGENIGRDTPYYHDVFQTILNGGILFVNEPGYIFLVKVTHVLGGTQQLIFLLYAILTIGCFMKFILRYSKNPYLSLLIFIFVGPFYLATYNQIRQFLAIGIFIAFIIPLIEKRQFLKFILLILVTAFFAHISAILLIPIYFVLNKKISLFKKIIILGIFNFSIGLIISLIAMTPYAYFVLRWVSDDKDLSLILIQVVISFIILLLEKKVFLKIKGHVMFFNMAFFSLLMLLPILLFKNLPYEMFLRINNYFFVSMIIVLPDLLLLFEKKSRFIINGVLILLVSMYFMRNTIIKGKVYDLYPYEYNLKIFN